MHAQLGKVEAELRLVENAHDDFFAEDGGHGGDAQVDLTAVGHDVHATFLRQSLFGDVHASDDLDARDHRGMHALGRFEHFAQFAVNAIANVRGVAVGFDVDVTGTGSERGQDGQVYQVHDWTAVHHLVEIGDRTLVDGLRLGDADVALFD